MTQGKFISLEGVDGAGKSTHIPYIADMLRNQGLEVLITREPGGTPLAERIRELLLHEHMHPETETLLMFAARREHLEQVILPALSRGIYVITDRFTDASFAYQHGGRGVDAGKITQLETWVQEGVQPDLTLLFDVPVSVSAARLAQARSPDRFERQGEDFFDRIRQAYLARAAQFPSRFRVIDAGKSLEDIQVTLKEIISAI